MSYYEHDDSYGYNDAIRKFETIDPGHADVFNAVVQELVHNDDFLKKIQQQKAEALTNHLNDMGNPHNISKEQLELEKVDNTADANKSVASAKKLTAARTINGTSFDGSKDITTENWGTERKVSIADSSGANTGQAVSVNGARDVTLKLPAIINASLSGTATRAEQDKNGNVISETYAKKHIYSDRYIALGTGATTPNENSSATYVAIGSDATATGNGSFAMGTNTTAAGRCSFATGGGGGYSGHVRAYGDYSHASGFDATASMDCGYAHGVRAIASSPHSFSAGIGTLASCDNNYVIGKFNKQTAGNSGTKFYSSITSKPTGDALVIGNGSARTYSYSASEEGTFDFIDYSRSNAFRVTYAGEVYALSAFNSSGADYAEFIKPWNDGNEEDEDRVGYFVTIKNGLLYKANEGDYVVGITSGNPSVVGNADEDYYWRYERDEFNRIVMEDVPELIEKTDEEGNIVIDEETHEPVMVETGNIIKNARMKWSDDYDPSKQNDYVERKKRKEWDYVGMVGVLPIRDDGTCMAGKYCKCGKEGIATLAVERDFDTYMVIERIAENIVSVILK